MLGGTLNFPTNSTPLDDELSINTNIINELEIAHDQTIFSHPITEQKKKYTYPSRCVSEKTMKQILRKFRAQIKDIYSKTYGKNRYNFDAKRKR
mgnify:CR=1 FL=1